MTFRIAWVIWSLGAAAGAAAVWFGLNGGPELSILFCFLAIGLNAVAVFSPKE